MIESDIPAAYEWSTYILIKPVTYIDPHTGDWGIDDQDVEEVRVGSLQRIEKSIIRKCALDGTPVEVCYDRSCDTYTTLTRVGTGEPFMIIQWDQHGEYQ